MWCGLHPYREDGGSLCLYYMFTSKDQKLVKIIRHEYNKCQLFLQRFDDNMSFIRLEFDGSQPIYVLEYKYLVAMLECPVIKKIGPIKGEYEKAAA